ncbi:sirohydrochlorin chelatase [Nocardia sp. NBC_00511]|uniref:sirohydrochlorin chelatase n=1 Tax=Nocardia sp. NBC_00511 TaxID=2903591 RepID=UPI0030E25000
MNPPGNGAVPAVLGGISGTAARRGRTGKPALIAVAHGSRDPRSATTMHAVVEQIAAARPDLDVRLAFLDLSAPSVDQVVDAVAAAGHSQAVVVPLLLGSAFHARVDLPELLDAARSRHPRLRLTQADVLGSDVRLIVALRDRVLAEIGPNVIEPGIPAPAMDSISTFALASSDSAFHRFLPGAPDRARLGVAVAAVGSSSAAANHRTASVAWMLSELTGWDTEVCFATTAPTVTEAAARLRARGCDEILVAPWFLAPGLLTDRLRDALPGVPHTETLCAHPLVAEVALDRYTAATLPLVLSA